MNKESVVDALQALMSEMGNRTKTAQLREVFPHIEEAKRAGLTNAKIVETLNAQGFDLTVKSFEMLLYRIRKRQSSSPISSAEEPTSLPVTSPHMKGTQQSSLSLPSPGRSWSTDQITPEKPLDELGGLDKKQRRERLADRFITPEHTNPLLKRIKDKQK